MNTKFKRVISLETSQQIQADERADARQFLDLLGWALIIVSFVELGAIALTIYLIPR